VDKIGTLLFLPRKPNRVEHFATLIFSADLNLFLQALPISELQSKLA
jgi:hypothetical protein